MDTNNEITIRTNLPTIFDLAARVEDWGDLLPHYRYVRLLKRKGNRKLVRMSAWRNFIPVTWTAICTVEPGRGADPGRITFKHVRGLVRGMHVEWWFEPHPERGEVRVGISHHLEKPPFPTLLLPGRLLEMLVGRGFIGYIAGKTLARMKILAERQTSSSRTGLARAAS